ncbi:preprotein translocase subunit SecG [Mycoplasma sp. 744]|uniref:preprotein translocase subunit SecG n=1 Tax=unclassified Mycoplasma TaxID=2683645 RepID=UPI00211C0399|nr:MULTISPECIES: preprotein translocase subunit SecG [unclassified Mycoplasma]MEA4115241.1 preprotein translocase subunit SecG [Mycoplasma sp. 744]UUM19247.1 preprotein translocase subunit SecG [Mycoplasma sp. 1018B]
MTAITIILVLLGLVIIIVSLLMSPESNAFSGALVESGDLELFKTSKERGIKKVLKYTMLIGGIFLIVFTIALRILMQ